MLPLRPLPRCLGPIGDMVVAGGIAGGGMQALREGRNAYASGGKAPPPSDNKYPSPPTRGQPPNDYGAPEAAAGAAYARPLPPPRGGATGGYYGGQSGGPTRLGAETDEDPRDIASRRYGYAPVGPAGGAYGGRVYAPPSSNGA
jgi:hypothetical protein